MKQEKQALNQMFNEIKSKLNALFNKNKHENTQNIKCYLKKLLEVNLNLFYQILILIKLSN